MNDFYKFCKNLNLDIIGTMCIPPNDGNTEKYFSEMNEINKELNFKELSMGMSGDYLEAIKIMQHMLEWAQKYLVVELNLF